MPAVGKGLLNKKKQFVQYPNIPSAIRPVPHGQGIPVPDAPESFSLESNKEDNEDEKENEDCSSGPSMSNDPDFDQEFSSEPHLITQGELHDLVKNLELPKNKAEPSLRS